MATYEWLLVDLIILTYNLTWMVFLTRKHYGQLTTTAGHIFELNVLVNVLIGYILWILLVDLKVLSFESMELLDFSVLVAIVGSQIETMVFLKTLTVNTMMTQTARKIILAMTMFSYGMAVFNISAWPSTMAPQSEVLLCAYLMPLAIDFKRKCIYFSIISFTLVIVISVMGFGVFRGLTIRRTRNNEEHTDDLRLKELRTERLFTVQAELNPERPRGIVEEDLVIQDIELDSIEVSPADHVNMSETETQQNPIGCDTPSQGRLFTRQAAIYDLNQETPRQMGTSPSMEHVMIDEISLLQDTNFENISNSNTMSEVQQDPIGCAPGIYMIMKTIQKYMKNTMISLIILTCSLPWYSTLMWGIITNSGCENTSIKFMVEMSEYGWYILTILLPLFIKLKLDRLSQ